MHWGRPSLGHLTTTGNRMEELRADSEATRRRSTPSSRPMLRSDANPHCVTVIRPTKRTPIGSIPPTGNNQSPNGWSANCGMKTCHTNTTLCNARWKRWTGNQFESSPGFFIDSNSKNDSPRIRNASAKRTEYLMFTYKAVPRPKHLTVDRPIPRIVGDIRWLVSIVSVILQLLMDRIGGELNSLAKMQRFNSWDGLY